MWEFNEYQTQLTDKVLASLNDEELAELEDVLTNVEFVKRLVSKDRKRAKDLDRDSSGRIIVDLSNPHILEDMDYFRESAIHFQKHGCYTKLMPNPNPQSEYGQWLRREIKRIWQGMTRASDGEWIPGDMYFYLNYFPIIQTKIKKGTKIGERVTDLPEVWEGVYWRFHYMHQARFGGLYDDFKGAHHGCEIARRGASKSYTLGSVLTKTFLLGENELSKSKVKSLALAYQKEYLIKDGLINKFVDGLTHCAKHTQFPSNRIKSSWTDMHWVLGFKNDTTGDDDGLLNEMIGVAIKDNSDKARGKRSSKMFYEEFGMFPGFLDLWQTSLPNVQEGEIVFGQAYSIGTGGTEGCLTAGNQVITGDGRSIDIKNLRINDTIVGYDVKSKSIVIEDVKYLNVTPGVKCVRIETSNGRKIECTRNHPIYSSNKSDCNERRIFQWIESSDLKVGDLITVPSSIPYFGDKSIWDPRAVGLLIGDGSYGEKQNVRIYSCDHEIIDYFEKNYKTTTQNSYLTKDGKEFKTITIKGVRDKLREVGIYGQTKNNKRLPPNYGSLNKNDLRLIIAGLFDTDGNVSVSLNKKRGTYSSVISLSSAHKELLVEVLLVLQKFGIHANIQTKKPNLNKKSGIIDKSNYYSLEISDVDSIINFHNEIPLLIGYKIDALRVAYEKALSKKSLRKNKEFYYEKIVSIEDVGEKDIYNLTTSGTHTYLANGIITHNSDFSGALEMINYPSGYNVYSLPNVYDRGSDGSKRTIFFFPGYVNSKGYYNKDGVSDVVGALISEIKFRVVLKYNSSDPMQLTKRKAETAFTLQDAIMRSSGTAYPADMLNDRINELNLDPKYPDSMWIGRLSMNNEGNVEYKVTPELKYITEFPHKDNKKKAAVCIKEQPKKDSAGKIPWGRYIAGADVYDDDGSNTLSLFSLFVLDTFTDELVFEYTGRNDFADDDYEVARLACLYYNAELNYENNKKGLFKHFSKHGCLYLLSDTLEYLKDKDVVKGNLYGNKSKGTGNYGKVGYYARRAIREWLLHEQELITVKEENGVPYEDRRNVTMINKLWSKALCQELAMWNVDGNFDRHDALAMLMLLREDKLRMRGTRSMQDLDNERSAGYLGNDPFFEKNYKSSKKDNY